MHSLRGTYESLVSLTWENSSWMSWWLMFYHVWAQTMLPHHLGVRLHGGPRISPPTPFSTTNMVRRKWFVHRRNWCLWLSFMLWHQWSLESCLLHNSRFGVSLKHVWTHVIFNDCLLIPLTFDFGPVWVCVSTFLSSVFFNPKKFPLLAIQVSHQVPWAHQTLFSQRNITFRHCRLFAQSSNTGQVILD